MHSIILGRVQHSSWAITHAIGQSQRVESGQSQQDFVFAYNVWNAKSSLQSPGDTLIVHQRCVPIAFLCAERALHLFTSGATGEISAFEDIKKYERTTGA